MKKTTDEPQKGIRWTTFTHLNDLDYADNLALLSHTQNHLQEKKTTKLCNYGWQFGLIVSEKKTETLTLNVPTPNPVKAYGKELPMTEQFTYLGSIVRVDEGG